MERLCSRHVGRADRLQKYGAREDTLRWLHLGSVVALLFCSLIFRFIQRAFAVASGPADVKESPHAFTSLRNQLSVEQRKTPRLMTYLETKERSNDIECGTGFRLVTRHNVSFLALMQDLPFLDVSSLMRQKTIGRYFPPKPSSLKFYLDHPDPIRLPPLFLKDSCTKPFTPPTPPKPFLYRPQQNPASSPPKPHEPRETLQTLLLYYYRI